MNEIKLYLESDIAYQLITQAIGDSTLADSTKRKYQSAVDNYIAKGYSLTDANQLRAYSLTIPESTKAFLKASIRKLSESIVLMAKSNATPENVLEAQAYVYQAEALIQVIKVVANKSEDKGIRLSAKQLTDMINLTRKNGDSLVELRDRIVLGLLSNACLRRQEAVTLQFKNLITVDGFPALDVLGKGNKKRKVKIAESLVLDIQKMKERIGDGYIIRPMLKRKNKPKGYTLIEDVYVGENMTATAVYNLVLDYGYQMGYGTKETKTRIDKKTGKESRYKVITNGFPCHNLRRSGARIAYDAGVPIADISLSLGHVNLATTMTYIGSKRDFKSQPSDFIPYA